MLLNLNKMDSRNAIKKRYYVISAILLLLGLIIMILPEKNNKKELSPEGLLLAISTEDRFFSPDDLARLIISGDPSIQLIDVRTADEYAAYSLPGAINIPLANLLDKDEDGDYVWEPYLDQEVKTNIFYSNGTVYANQAWMLARRLKFSNNYVMKGGLNAFFEDIIHAKRPMENAPQNEHNLYSFRKAAAMFFGGGNNISSQAGDAKPLEGVPVKKKKKEASGGGC
jgi:sulfur-carrier protein adenylyltransferase/sulfurtransferase